MGFCEDRLSRVIESNVSQYDEEYLPGFKNKLIRYYFYLTKGLEILNQFRNLFLAILALYLALKWDNVFLLPAIFLPSLIVLAISGYYSVHHLGKITEWLNTRFGTHYTLDSYSLTKKQYEILEEIRDLLRNDLHPRS